MVPNWSADVAVPLCCGLMHQCLEGVEVVVVEVVGGVVWVWLPIFGINEVPSFTVILGGIIITSAVLFHGYGARKKREPILP